MLGTALKQVPGSSLVPLACHVCTSAHLPSRKTGDSPTHFKVNSRAHSVSQAGATGGWLHPTKQGVTLNNGFAEVALKGSDMDESASHGFLKAWGWGWDGSTRAWARPDRAPESGRML